MWRCFRSCCCSQCCGGPATQPGPFPPAYWCSPASLHKPASGVSLAESKERFYQYMYYSGLSPKEVATAMVERRFIVLAPLFGVERIIEGLAADPKPISIEEMRDELRHYTDYTDHF